MRIILLYANDVPVKQLAKNIYFLRKKAKLQQAQMPDVLGISRTTWSNYENDVSEPNVSGLIQIANFFGVSIDDLIRKDLSKDVQDSDKTKVWKKEVIVQENVKDNVQVNKGKRKIHTKEDAPEQAQETAMEAILKEMREMRQEIDAIKKAGRLKGK